MLIIYTQKDRQHKIDIFFLLQRSPLLPKEEWWVYNRKGLIFVIYSFSDHRQRSIIEYHILTAIVLWGYDCN
jgi:hypothetical protein